MVLAHLEIAIPGSEADRASASLESPFQWP
jgi:hypothetical protein